MRARYDVLDDSLKPGLEDAWDALAQAVEAAWELNARVTASAVAPLVPAALAAALLEALSAPAADLALADPRGGLDELFEAAAGEAGGAGMEDAARRLAGEIGRAHGSVRAAAAGVAARARELAGELDDILDMAEDAVF